jgi:hypothetical protein
MPDYIKNFIPSIYGKEGQGEQVNGNPEGKDPSVQERSGKEGRSPEKSKQEEVSSFNYNRYSRTTSCNLIL